MDTTRTRHALTAGTLALLVGALAACSTAGPAADSSSPSAAAEASSRPSPSASPSPSPSVDVAAARETEDVEEVKQVLTDFYALGGKVSNEGYGGWQVMAGFWADDEAWQQQVATYEKRTADGWHTEGVPTIAEWLQTDYDPGAAGAGDEEITVEVCNDASAVTTYDGDGGKVARKEGLPARFTVDYRLIPRYEDGRWAIVERTATEHAC